MLQCKQVTRLVASGEVETLSWRGRIRLRLHLLMCRHCRNYTRQMAAIGRAVRDIWADRPVDEATRERLEREILTHLKH